MPILRRVHSAQELTVKKHTSGSVVVLLTFIQINTIPVQSLTVSSQAGVFGFSDMQRRGRMTVLELNPVLQLHGCSWL